MSDVEKYWEAIRAHAVTQQPAWHELDPMKQHMVISSINLLLQVLA